MNKNNINKEDNVTWKVEQKLFTLLKISVDFSTRKRKMTVSASFQHTVLRIALLTLLDFRPVSLLIRNKINIPYYVLHY